MLTISDLTYRIAGRTILEDVHLNLNNGWKTGVIGANGCGKTTLFKLITGELQADRGDVTLTATQSIGIVRQDMPDTDMPLIEVVLAADAERATLLQDAETETDPYKIADIHTRLNDIDAYAAPSRAASILSGLGFKDDEIYAPFSSFSGGWRMRVALAAALFQEPDMLLLDEPTNHLDLEAIMWLETYLVTYPHSILLISHDRDLLNKCADHIVHIENRQAVIYTGNYDTFERERAEKRGLQQKMHEKQQAQRAHIQSYIDRFRYKASKAKQAQSRLKALERMDIVDAVIADRITAFKFPQPEELSPPILSIDHADVGYHAGEPVLRDIYERIDMDDRIALLGANGNGKSTLIKLIAGKLAPMKGAVVPAAKLRIGYFSQHQTEELDVDSTPYQEMARLMEGAGESKIRAKLGQFGFSKILADNRIGDLSGGEKARLLFALMSFSAPHLLLLDEPTNHLDMDAREALVKALNDYEGAVIIVSHDPSMVERVADRLWLIEGGACRDFDGDLNAYRKHVVKARRAARREGKAQKAAEKKTEKKQEQQKQKQAENRKNLAPLKQEIGRLEKNIAALTAEKEALEAEMGDAAFYEAENRNNVVKAQQLYAELQEKLDAAEAAWLEAQENYEAVRGAATTG